ncbi:MAG: hypothetical protein ACI8PB_002866 [Desulforhopalus sp.]|jgi:hypothetical protein
MKNILYGGLITSLIDCHGAGTVGDCKDKKVGSVNEDAIYSSFHPPPDISDKITAAIGSNIGDTILKDFLKEQNPYHFLTPFILLICLQLSAMNPNAYASEDPWKYIDTFEGVSLYRSQKEIEGFLPFKATAVLNVPYQKVVMALVDVERKNSWAPKLKSTTVHNEKSANCFEYSEYYTTPWPYKDREFLLLGTVDYNGDRVLFSAVNSENKPLADNSHLLVNIEKLEFSIIPLSANITRVSFTFSGDLGGWIPRFVRAIIQKKWPVRFIQSLQKTINKNEVVETVRYQSLKRADLVIPPQSMRLN